MKKYELEDDDVIQGIIETLEKDTDKKVFTIRIFNGHEEHDDKLELIVVFEDKDVLHTFVTFKNVEGKMEVGLKGNFL